MLYLGDNGAASDERLQSIRTDQAGQFRFEPVAELRDGQTGKFYWISATAKGRASLVLDQPGLRSQNTDRLRIAMSEAASVRGKITGPDGRPVAGAKVWAGLTHGRMISGIHTATTDAEGVFEISDLDMSVGKPVPVPGKPGASIQWCLILCAHAPRCAQAMATLSKVSTIGRRKSTGR